MSKANQQYYINLITETQLAKMVPLIKILAKLKAQGTDKGK